MSIARFQVQPGSFCQIELWQDRITSLAPQELGILIPFEVSHQLAENGHIKWEVSYLYAELWAVREDETRLIIPSLPEFTTDSFRPSSLRFPLTPAVVSQLEKQRYGGDLRLTLHIQATLVGTVSRDQIQDPVRRKTLEALGMEQEFFGPVRRSDDLAIQVAKLDWEEKVLPQWDLSDTGDMASSMPIAPRSAVVNSHLDLHALARFLQRVSAEADVEEILGQFQDPIVGL